jgi:integrase
MGKNIQKLTNVQVKGGKPWPNGKARIYSDGGGLYLRASSSGRSYFFKYCTPEIQPNGRHYEANLGLGSADNVSLADARQAHRDADRQRREAWKNWRPGDPRPANDPVEANRLLREARKTPAVKTSDVLTFDQAADRYFDQVKDSKWKNPQGRRSWIVSIRQHVSPSLGAKSIDAITPDDVFACLDLIWTRIPRTASHIRSRIETVLDFAGRYADNPARSAALRCRLPELGPRTIKHHGAMPYQEIPAFMAELRGIKNVKSAALQFVVLTAARRGEVLGSKAGEIAPLTWPELDLDSRIWTVPAARMKGGRVHRVPLSDAATEIVNGMARWCDQVFPISADTVYKFFCYELRPSSGFSPHGFRSSFKEYCTDVLGVEDMVCSVVC